MSTHHTDIKNKYGGTQIFGASCYTVTAIFIPSKKVQNIHKSQIITILFTKNQSFTQANRVCKKWNISRYIRFSAA